MEATKKLQTWVVILLLWNVILLGIIGFLLWTQVTTAINTDELAASCTQAVTDTLKDACSTP